MIDFRSNQRPTDRKTREFWRRFAANICVARDGAAPARPARIASDLTFLAEALEGDRRRGSRLFFTATRPRRSNYWATFAAAADSPVAAGTGPDGFVVSRDVYTQHRSLWRRHQPL